MATDVDNYAKANFMAAAVVNIFTNAIKDKDILTIEDPTPYIEKSKELAMALIDSL